MPAIAQPPHIELLPPTYHFIEHGAANTTQPFGQEWEQLKANAQAVYEHWLNSGTCLISRAENLDGLSYNRVPGRNHFKVKTQHKYIGRGLPKFFFTDDV